MGMRASVWDTIMSNVADGKGWHVFGLALEHFQFRRGGGTGVPPVCWPSDRPDIPLMCRTNDDLDG